MLPKQVEHERKWRVVGRSPSRSDGDVLWLFSHADSDWERLKQSSAWTVKACLTELINQIAWAFVFSEPWKPRRHRWARDGGGMGCSESSVITFLPLIIHKDSRLPPPTCMFRGTWACMRWHRCERLDWLTGELGDMLTMSSPAKWHEYTHNVQTGSSSSRRQHFTCSLPAFYLILTTSVGSF